MASGLDLLPLWQSMNDLRGKFRNVQFPSGFRDPGSYSEDFEGSEEENMSKFFSDGRNFSLEFQKDSRIGKIFSINKTKIPGEMIGT